MCRSPWARFFRPSAVTTAARPCARAIDSRRKIVDFVIEDRASGAILALVELDDRSHNAASRSYARHDDGLGRLSHDPASCGAGEPCRDRRPPSDPSARSNVVGAKFPLSFWSRMIQNRAMPIRPEHRWLYPIDWPEISRIVRFERAAGRCEHCRRPHGRHVAQLVGTNGVWWDADIRLGAMAVGVGSATPGLRAARRDPHDAQARLSGNRAPQPRSDLQRPALAQSRCSLPAMPYDPRRARASSAPLVERLRVARDRRSFLGPLQLDRTRPPRLRGGRCAWPHACP